MLRVRKLLVALLTLRLVRLAKVVTSIESRPQCQPIAAPAGARATQTARGHGHDLLLCGGSPRP